MDRTTLSHWIEGYERAWRTAGAAGLAGLFSTDVSYLVEPYAETIVGLDALADWWEENREGPDEVFTLVASIVAVDGDVGVARIEVTYGDPVDQEYRDLWVVRFDADGRCSVFEEWPFWPGHGRSPTAQARAAAHRDSARS